MKTTKIFMTASAAMLLFSACSTNNTPTPDPTGKSAKFIFSVSGLDHNEAYESVHFNIVGSKNTGGGGQTIWKLNGNTLANQVGVSINETEIPNGVEYVVESIEPLMVINAGVTAHNFNAPFTVKFKSIINGKVENEINQTVSDNFNVNFQY